MFARFAHLAIAMVAACGHSGGSNERVDGAIGGDGADASIDAPAIVDATSFVDKVTVGYQAWFAAAGDGSPINAWSHWGGSPPAPGAVTFELYPDVRGYPDADLVQAGFAHLGDGSPARLFGSWSDGVIDTHFRWL